MHTAIRLQTYFHKGASRKNIKVLKKRIPEALYKKIHETIIVACVDLVVKRGKRFLLVKRKNHPEKGKWFLPGGRVFHGERLHEAALRKLKEETGLVGKVKQYLGAGEHFGWGGYFKGISSHIITFVFLVEAKNTDLVRIDSQSDAFAWFNSVNPRMPVYVKDFLKKAGFK